MSFGKAPSFPITSSTVTPADPNATNILIYLKIIIGIFLVFVILVSILGNLLVCVAVSSDRKLRKLGNLFIVSLAIADLCVGALVMTFALANDLLDYWPFGPQLCEIWIAFDISCSTCSIINLCAIALDRFAHIKDPMRYNRWMTKKVVIGAVSLIWLVSCGISFVPISLGWHKPDHSTQAVLENKTIGLDNILPTPQFNFTLPVHFPLHKSLHYLFRRQRNIPNSALESMQNSLNSFKESNHKFDNYQRFSSKNQEMRILNAPSSLLSFSSTSNNFGYSEDESMLPQCALDLTPSYAVVSSIISFYLPCIVMLYLYAKLYSICQQHVKSIKSMTKFQPTQLILKQETDNQQDLSPIRKTMTPAKTSGGSIQAAPRISVSSNIGSIAGAQVPGSQNHVTEHKAAVTLGIIMGTFLACWMPFFCMNIVAAFCKTCIPLMVFKILTWLGYFNSCLNPVIYSIFNTEFRDAFRRILIRYLFNGDTTAACSRLVPCKTPRSSTATVTGTLCTNNQAHQKSDNNIPQKNHYDNVKSTIIMPLAGSSDRFPEVSINNGSLDSGNFNALPQKHNNCEEDVEVELILQQKVHEPTLNSPNDIKFSSIILVDKTQQLSKSVSGVEATYVSTLGGAIISENLLNPLINSKQSVMPSPNKLTRTNAQTTESKLKVYKIKPRIFHCPQHQSLDYGKSSEFSNEFPDTFQKHRNGSFLSLDNGIPEHEDNISHHHNSLKFYTTKVSNNVSQITQL